jgi:1-acyl-sn-glycerol-3-phosphate acyltransferase
MEETNQLRASRMLVFTQALLGLGAHVFLAWPYLRRAHGLDRLRPEQRYLFACNHVSLLDSILLGGLLWRCGCYPILVLGDKNVWRASWIKRAISSRTSFLLQRGKINPDRIRELQTFARASDQFHLMVYPEGTRGDGIHVAPCQPGLYFIAQEARVPIVPVFIQNMQLVSTKTGRFHPIGGLRKVEVRFGEPIEAATYLQMPREEFGEFIRRSIAALPPTQSAAHLSPVLPRA